MKHSWVIAFLTVIALLFMAALAWGERDRVLTGHNDFIQLYSGARLVATPGLYDAASVRQLQEREIGATGESWRHSRPPYYAAFLSPLGLLPYPAAYWVWESLALAALVAFVGLWRPTSRPITALFTSLSLPAFAGLMNGQDVKFLLLWISLAVHLVRKEKPFVGGLLFCLIAAKFHLFVLIPIVILAQRNWRFGKGFLAGGLALAALSFAVAGMSWPVAYAEVLQDPVTHPSIVNMPNLHGLFSVLLGMPWLQWCVAPAVVAAAWLVARRMPFEYALAAALAGSFWRRCC